MERPPNDFDEEDAYSWCLWVLEHRLPILPENVRKGEAVPIARWAGPKLSAVLRVEWSWSDGPRGEQDYLAAVVQTFRRTDDGWEGSDSDGGGMWPDPPFTLPVIGPREVQAWGTHSDVADGWNCSAHWGRVGAEIAYAEVANEDDTVRRPIDSPIGATIVALDPSVPSTVRYLTEDGEVAHVLTNPA